jgi:hypothetical protein
LNESTGYRDLVAEGYKVQPRLAVDAMASIHTN